MSRRWLGLSAAALLGLMLIPEPAAAQRRGFSYGYNPWSGANFGYGNFGYSDRYGAYYGNRYGAYYGDRWGGYGSSYGPYSGQYYGRSYYSPYYYGGYSSSPYYYGSYGRPRYYGGSYGSTYYDGGWYGSTYSSPSASYYDAGSANYGSTSESSSGSGYGETPANAATIDVKVPPDATLWFDDTQTTQTGSLRQFVTPPLDPNKNFAYDVRARWREADRDVDQKRHVTVRANEQAFVDFTARPADSEKGKTSGRAEAHEGTLVSISDNEIVMTDRKGRHTHILAPDAEIIIDAQPARAEDLKANVRIRVTTKAGDPKTATRIEVLPAASGRPDGSKGDRPKGDRPKGRAERTETHEGNFVSLNNNQLVMTDQNGKRHTHTLAADAQVMIDGQPARPEDLKADMRIRVSTKKGDPNTATRIEVLNK